MDLKEHRVIEVRFDSGDGGIEALEVSDLERAALGGGEGDHRIRLFQRGGDGLLDQDVDTGTKQSRGHLEMRGSGNADRGRVHPQAGFVSEARFRVGIDGHTVLLVQRGGT